MGIFGAKLSKFGVSGCNGNRCILLVLVFFFSFFNSTVSFSQTVKSSIKTVVIDAGHGGKDPGCHGDFAHEKHVCLAMALKLGAMIKEKYPDVKVIYTRDKDVFLELKERSDIANKAKADLFICIHANAGSAAAYGTETYVLGLHRTESQQKVADRENTVIALEDDKGAKYKEFDLSPDAIIAKQLQLAVYLKNAIVFAENLQREFKKIGRYDRGVKQAGFFVLYNTTMPSVLIETGFLTNPSEEKFLGEADGQGKMAEAMFKAFENYKNQLEGKSVKTESGTKSEETPTKPKDDSGSIAPQNQQPKTNPESLTAKSSPQNTELDNSKSNISQSTVTSTPQKGELDNSKSNISQSTVTNSPQKGELDSSKSNISQSTDKSSPQRTELDSSKSNIPQSAINSDNPFATGLDLNGNPEAPRTTIDSTSIIFRVQIETSDKKLSLHASRFQGLEVFEYQQSNVFKYCVGAFKNDLLGAKHYRNELVEKGFQNAFVVAFCNGERISMEKAIKLAEK